MRQPLMTTASLAAKGHATIKTTIFLLLFSGALAFSGSSNTHLRPLSILIFGAFTAYFCIYLTIAHSRLRNRYRDHVNQLKQTDGLTGLASRQLFLSTMFERLKSANYQNKPFALLLVDIDRFKELDTILGSKNGDLLLQEFADRLKHFQKENALVARLSGNEFALILEESGAELDI